MKLEIGTRLEVVPINAETAVTVVSQGYPRLDVGIILFYFFLK